MRIVVFVVALFIALVGAFGLDRGDRDRAHVVGLVALCVIGLSAAIVLVVAP